MFKSLTFWYIQKQIDAIRDDQPKTAEVIKGDIDKTLREMGVEEYGVQAVHAVIDVVMNPGNGGADQTTSTAHGTQIAEDVKSIQEHLQDEQDEAFRQAGVPERIIQSVREMEAVGATAMNEEESIQDILRKKGVAEYLIQMIQVTNVSGDRLSDIQDGKVEAPDFFAAAAADLPIHPDAVGKANIRMHVYGEGLDEIIDVPLKTK